MLAAAKSTTTIGSPIGRGRRQVYDALWHRLAARRWPEAQRQPEPHGARREARREARGARREGWLVLGSSVPRVLVSGFKGKPSGKPVRHVWVGGFKGKEE